MNYTMHKLSRLGLLCWLLIPLCAAAEAEPAAEAPAAAQTATDTKQSASGSAAEWLEIQREGKMPGKLLPIPGDEATASYQRYMSTFGSGRQSAPATASSTGTAK